MSKVDIKALAKTIGGYRKNKMSWPKIVEKIHSTGMMTINGNKATQQYLQSMYYGQKGWIEPPKTRKVQPVKRQAAKVFVASKRDIETLVLNSKEFTSDQKIEILKITR